MSILIPPINTQLVGEELDLGTTELNFTAKPCVHVTIYFYALSLYKVYALQNVAVEKMKVMEGTLVKKVRESNNIVNNMNKKVKETEQRSKMWEADKHRLDTTITLTCSNFTNKGITHETVV